MSINVSFISCHHLILLTCLKFYKPQIFGLILTYGSSKMVDELGQLWANSFLTACLAVGFILTVVMKANLKRQQAVAEEQMKV